MTETSVCEHASLTLVSPWETVRKYSAAMTKLIAARDWLTVVQFRPYAHKLNPLELV